MAASERLSPIYRCTRALLRLYLGGLCRVRVERCAIPPTPFILSMNHRSALDMFLYVAILPRRIKFLAKRELFAYPVLGPILRRWCIPVDRGRYDRDALVAAARALEAGYVLSVFPEGTRRAHLAYGHGGAVLLASWTGMPVVPGGIVGDYRPFGRITVRFGEPLTFPRRMSGAERREATDRLMETIRALVRDAEAARPRRRAEATP